VEEVTTEGNIDDNLKTQYKEELDEAVIVFSTSKTNSVVYRGALTKLFWDLAEGMKNFFTELPVNLLEKLVIKFSLTASPLSKIIDGFTATLSSLILITGHIVDVLHETTKSIEYGNKHLTTIRAGKAGKLLKSADFQNDLITLASIIPAAIATVYSVQGGLALLLATLTTMRSTSTLELATKFNLDLLPTGTVLTTWRKLEKTSQEQQDGLRDILDKIRNTAQSA